MRSPSTGVAGGGGRTTCSSTSAGTAVVPTVPSPGGTAEPASARAASVRTGARPGLKRRVGMLERKADRLSQRAQRLEAVSERFDEWESCVSWVPVTEPSATPTRSSATSSGRGAVRRRYRTALHIDRSDWDDPDYMVLALVGGDRPGRTCQDEPGEGVD